MKNIVTITFSDDAEISFIENEHNYEPETPKKLGQIHISESYGFLTFQAEDIAKSRLLDYTDVYYLEFFGDSIQNTEIGDHYRANTLTRLTEEKYAWYISFWGDVVDSLNPGQFIPINQSLKDHFIKENQLNYIEIETPEYGKTSTQRLFFELPHHLVSSTVKQYWPRNYPACPIQGLLMLPGQIDWLRKWHNKPISASLFQEIVNHVQMLFYSYPSENHSLAFITNKMTFQTMKNMIGLDNLGT